MNVDPRAYSVTEKSTHSSRVLMHWFPEGRMRTDSSRLTAKPLNDKVKVIFALQGTAHTLVADVLGFRLDFAPWTVETIQACHYPHRCKRNR